MRHHHSMLSCEPGQVLIEAAISIGRMWVMVPDRDTFFLFENFDSHCSLIEYQLINFLTLILEGVYCDNVSFIFRSCFQIDKNEKTGVENTFIMVSLVVQ